MKKKELTINDLAVMMNEGFEKSGRITDKKIEDLAGMVQRGFVQIDKRFEQVDKRFEQVDKRFEQVDKRFEQVDKRFDKLEKKVDDIQNKVTQIDRRLFSVEEDVAEIKIKQYGDLLKRINFIEKTLGIAR
ncbi:MAG: hypothetical protein US25_C0002G0005 [Candidatus Moranbacteria bacterium GW2011_GWE1_36_7]|nr:MAG: hypothetical protein UR99_C0011G0005 [Candidatus Moranbacteria bacterium GW2011_GWD2_36_12]KKQ06593.1 MAG: hypothetical protein US16_C0013G0005 [Candidatus Moranbacteria bacterium GW2011_GWE2_36_40]KKQ15538.1 MAG: hypothetical protein US25_C0002G0005 [Candidatus Moranbacteria bacterium GW2011_GWE1_36_7]